MAEGFGIYNHPPPRLGFRRSSQWSRNEIRRRSDGSYRSRLIRWPHLASLYASTHQLDEDGKHPDPMMGQDNVFDPTEPYNAYRYYIQPVARSEFSIEEPPYTNRPMYKDEESRSSDYTSGDSFRRGSTCRVLLCVSLVLSFIGVVVAAITLAVLLSQSPRSTTSALIQPEVYQSEASLMGQEFNEKLLDKDSEEFRKLSAEVCTALEQIFTDQDSPIRHEFAGCEVMEFRNGSVQTIFRIKLLPKSPDGFKNEARLIQKVQEHFATKIKQFGPWQSVKFNPEFLRRFIKVSLAPTTTTAAVTNTTTTLLPTTQPTIKEDTTVAVSVEEALTTQGKIQITTEQDTTSTTTEYTATVLHTDAVETSTFDRSHRESDASTSPASVQVSDIAIDDKINTTDLVVDITTGKPFTTRVLTDNITVETVETTDTPEHVTRIVDNITGVPEIPIGDTATVNESMMFQLPFDNITDMLLQNLTMRDENFTDTDLGQQTSTTNLTEDWMIKSTESDVTTVSEAKEGSSMHQTSSGLTQEALTTESTAGFMTEEQTTAITKLMTDKVLPIDSMITQLSTDITEIATNITETHVITSTESPDVTQTSKELHVNTSTESPDVTHTSKEMPVDITETKLSTSPEIKPTTQDMLIETAFNMTPSAETPGATEPPVTSQMTETTDTTFLNTSSTYTPADPSIISDHSVVEATVTDDTGVFRNDTIDVTKEITTPSNITEITEMFANITDIPFDNYTDMFDLNYTDLYLGETTFSPLDLEQALSNVSTPSNETETVSDQPVTSTSTESSEFVMKKYTIVEEVLPITSSPLQVNVSILEPNATSELMMSTTTSRSASEPQTEPTTAFHMETDAVPLVDMTPSSKYTTTSESQGVETTVSDSIFTSHTTVQATSQDSHTIQNTTISDITTPYVADGTAMQQFNETTSVEDFPTHREYTTTQSTLTSDTTKIATSVTDVKIGQQTSQQIPVTSQQMLPGSASVETSSISERPPISSVESTAFGFVTTTVSAESVATQDKLLVETTFVPSMDTFTTIAGTPSGAKAVTDVVGTDTSTETSTLSAQSTSKIDNVTEMIKDEVTEFQMISNNVTSSIMTVSTPKVLPTESSELKEIKVTKELLVANTSMSKSEIVTVAVTEADHQTNDTSTSEASVTTTEGKLLPESTTVFAIHDGDTVKPVTQLSTRTGITQSVQTPRTDAIPVDVDSTTSSDITVSKTTQFITGTSTESFHRTPDTTNELLKLQTSTEGVTESHGLIEMPMEHPQTTSGLVTDTAGTRLTRYTTAAEATTLPSVSVTEIVPRTTPDMVIDENITNLIDTSNITDKLESAGVTETINMTDVKETHVLIEGVTDSGSVTDATRARLTHYTTATETTKLHLVTEIMPGTIHGVAMDGNGTDLIETANITDEVETQGVPDIVNVTDMIETHGAIGNVTVSQEISNLTVVPISTITQAIFDATERPNVTHIIETFGDIVGTNETETSKSSDVTNATIVPHTFEVLNETETLAATDRMSLFQDTKAPDVLFADNITESISATDILNLTPSPDANDIIEVHAILNISKETGVTNVPETTDTVVTHATNVTEGPVIPIVDDGFMNATRTDATLDIPLMIDPSFGNETGFANETAENMTSGTQYTTVGTNDTMTNESETTYMYKTSTLAPLYNVTTSPNQTETVTEFMEFENATGLFDFNTTDFYGDDNFTDYIYENSTAVDTSFLLETHTQDSSIIAERNLTDSANLTTSVVDSLSTVVTTPMPAVNATVSQGETSSTQSDTTGLH